VQAKTAGDIKLTTTLYTAAVERAGIKSDDVEEVFFGNVCSAKSENPPFQPLFIHLS